MQDLNSRQPGPSEHVGANLSHTRPLPTPSATSVPPWTLKSAMLTTESAARQAGAAQFAASHNAGIAQLTFFAKCPELHALG